MSQRVCSTIADLQRHTGCMIATCLRGGRIALLSVHRLVDHLNDRGWSLHYHDVRERLRCDSRTGGCGTTMPRLAFHQGKHPPIGGLSLVVVAPRGVDPVEWMLADERGRKRMIQRVRG